VARRALIVVDMQRDLCSDPRRSAQVNEMLPHLRELIAHFDRHGESVVYTRFELSANDPQFARFGDVYCVEGTEGAQLIPELTPPLGHVITKRKHSAFYETELDELLVAHGAGEVFLAGLQTQICILTTAADASFRGYRVIVVDDCVVSTHDETKLDALDWIARYVGETRTSTEVIGWLDERR
jgi:nicotinamidase-related amidase